MRRRRRVSEALQAAPCAADQGDWAQVLRARASMAAFDGMPERGAVLCRLPTTARGPTGRRVAQPGASAPQPAIPRR